MSWTGTPIYTGNKGGGGTAAGHGAGAGDANGDSTPLHPPVMTTTSPTPSPRRAHFPLGATHLPIAGPSSPRMGRIVPQRMSSDGSDRDGSPGVDSPSRRTTLVMGFSPGATSSPLPSVAENATADSPSLRQQISSMTSPLARMPSQLTTPIEQTFPAGIQTFGSPGLSPRRLPAELPPRSRRNSAAPVSISLRSRSRSATPRGSHAGLPTSSNNSGQATPNRTSQTVTPKGDGSSRGSGKRPVFVQMGSTTSKRVDSWTPDFEMEEHVEEDDWTPAGGMLLGDEDERPGRSWTSMTDDDNDDIMSRPIFAPGDQFGEGLLFQGEVIVPAIGRAHGHDIDHPLRRGGSEIGMPRRTGPVGMGATDGRERRKTVYEIIKAAGEGSFAQVYHIREKGGKRRDYALKIVGRPALSEDQYENQLFEAQIHLSLPIHTNIVTLHETLQTEKWLFLMLEWCPGDDLFYWLEKNKHRPHKEPVAPQTSSPPPNSFESNHILSSSKLSSSTIPFSPGAMFHGLASQHPFGSSFSSSVSGSPFNTFSPSSQAFGASPAASMIFSHHNHTPSHAQALHLAQTPPTPSLLSAFSANTLLRADRLRLIASMFSQMCEAVAVCHDIGVSHRDIKPENFICCDSVELETVHEDNINKGLGFGDGDEQGGFGPQAKRKVIVKLTDFGLATTIIESEDMLCGSKPYMSYECRNNVGPNYLPAPADVWSLGIVLLNMIFHRSCWSEPTYDDSKFADFVDRPKEHLTARFTGIGNEVATFLANHVLCIDVGDRVSARDFGKWVKNLPEMMAGKAAVKEMRSVAKEARIGGDKAMFAKSPIGINMARKTKPSTSALTSTAPITSPSFQGLSSLPPPSHLTNVNMVTPELERDVPSASTVEEQPTPAEPTDVPSPDSSEVSPVDQLDINPEDQARSPSTQQKRRKRGVRKGKAAQAALAAENPKPTQPEREALLSELAQASQSLARDLSRTHRDRIDTASPEHFPPLGTSPAQLAQAKRSKWRDMLSFSSTADNPELAALARRVAERDSGGMNGKGGFGNWSAPAKMQDDHRVQLASGRPGFKQTNTMSTSGVTSQLSSFGAVVGLSSATSTNIEEESEGSHSSSGKGTPEVSKVLGNEGVQGETKEAKEAEEARQKKAVQAAAALSSNLGAMGSFGSRPQHVPRHGPLHGRNLARAPASATATAPAPAPAPSSATPIPAGSNIHAPFYSQGHQGYQAPHRPKPPAHVNTHAAALSKSPPRQTPAAVLSASSPSPTAVKSAVTKTTVASTTTASDTTATLTSTTSATSRRDSSNATTNAASSSEPEPISNERQGKLKGQMQFLNKLMQGVKLSNKKD